MGDHLHASEVKSSPPPPDSDRGGRRRIRPAAIAVVVIAALASLATDRPHWQLRAEAEAPEVILEAGEMATFAVTADFDWLVECDEDSPRNFFRIVGWAEADTGRPDVVAYALPQEDTEFADIIFGDSPDQVSWLDSQSSRISGPRCESDAEDPFAIRCRKRFEVEVRNYGRQRVEVGWKGRYTKRAFTDDETPPGDIDLNIELKSIDGEEPSSDAYVDDADDVE